MPRVKDLTGRTFGRLFVTGLNHVNIRAYWYCLCNCGRTVSVHSNALQTGNTRSCGCLSRELLQKRRECGLVGNITHLASRRGKRTVEYITWVSMIQRCENARHVSFKYYGLRGIKVCERWRNSFEAFLSDMGKKPIGMSLDRINNNGNYEPSNCRWATCKEQRKNQNPRRAL